LCGCYGLGVSLSLFLKQRTYFKTKNKNNYMATIVDCTLAIEHEVCGVPLTVAGVVEVAVLRMEDATAFTANVSGNLITALAFPVGKKGKRLATIKNGITFTDINEVDENSNATLVEAMMLKLADAAGQNVREVRAHFAECQNCADFGFILKMASGKRFLWAPDPEIATTPVGGSEKVWYVGQDAADRGTTASVAQFDLKFERRTSGARLYATEISSTVALADYLE
jgi:hypothetical protein